MVRLFVYGTLRHGGSANFYLNKADLLKSGIKAPDYQMYNMGRYPAVVEKEDPESFIVGDIYEVDLETLNRIDRFEGLSYQRKFDDRLKSFIYLAKEGVIKNQEQIKSGDWLSFARARRIKDYP